MEYGLKERIRECWKSLCDSGSSSIFIATISAFIFGLTQYIMCKAFYYGYFTRSEFLSALQNILAFWLIMFALDKFFGGKITTYLNKWVLGNNYEATKAAVKEKRGKNIDAY